MNDKTKSKVDTQIEAGELTDEALENVNGGAIDIFLHLDKVKSKGTNEPGETIKIDVIKNCKW